MQSIAQVQSDDRNMNQLQQNISTAVTPLLRNPVLNGIILDNVSLVMGANSVQHKLNRKLQGWVLVRVRNDATIYDTQDSNPTPEVTLHLVASADVIVNLYVF